MIPQALTGSLRVAFPDEGSGWEWGHRPAAACCRALPGAACWDVRLCAGSKDSPMMAVLRDVAGCEVSMLSASRAGGAAG